MRKEFLYPSTLHETTMRAYGEDLRDIVDIAHAHYATVVFIIPPTLLGDLPGMDTLVDILDEIKQETGAAWYDYSSAIQDFALYEDHDHLTAEGVAHFAREYIGPVLAGVDATQTPP